MLPLLGRCVWQCIRACTPRWWIPGEKTQDCWLVLPMLKQLGPFPHLLCSHRSRRWSHLLIITGIKNKNSTHITTGKISLRIWRACQAMHPPNKYQQFVEVKFPTSYEDCVILLSVYSSKIYESLYHFLKAQVSHKLPIQVSVKSTRYWSM